MGIFQQAHEVSIVYLAVIIATCWGGSFVVIKHVTEHVPPFLAVSLRVGMAVSYGLSFAMNRRLLSGAKGIDLHGSLYQQEISSLMLIIPLTLLSGQWQNTGWLEHADTIIPGLLYLGVLATAIGSLIYLWLLREWGMIRASVMVYLVPVSAVVLDMIIYRNFPHLAELVGGMVIILGVMLVQDNNIVLEFLRHKRTGALLTR